MSDRKQPKPLPEYTEYGLLAAGSLIVALSFNLFLRPNQIASGGISGISIIVQYSLGVQPAITQWVLNIPLFIAGWLLLGRQFGYKTAVGSFILPLFVYFTGGLPALSTNTLLAAIYGGVGVGVGLGIVFLGRGSTGGLDLAAQIIHKYMGVSLGIAVAMLDGLVILAAGIVFTPEKALIALIGLFITSKTIDIMQVGLSTSKVAYIISNHSSEMSEAILKDLDRGLTKLNATGGYTGEQRDILMVVVRQREVLRLKAVVKAIDPGAFLILSDVHEVLGKGFKGHQ